MGKASPIGRRGRSRARGSWALRWGGLAAAMVIVAAFALSVRWGWGWHTDHGPSFYSNRGGLHLSWNDFPVTRSRNTGWILDDNFSPKLRRYMGPLTLWVDWASAMGGNEVVLPYWMLLGLTAAPTALAWRRWSRCHRPGLCPGCGYNLAGLPTAAACPECGTGRSP